MRNISANALFQVLEPPRLRSPATEDGKAKCEVKAQSRIGKEIRDAMNDLGKRCSWWNGRHGPITVRIQEAEVEETQVGPAQPDLYPIACAGTTASTPVSIGP